MHASVLTRAESEALLSEIERLETAVEEARKLLDRADRMLTGQISELLPTSKVAS
jgi:hypothetical protein